jgi:hypothetical protein
MVYGYSVTTGVHTWQAQLANPAGFTDMSLMTLTSTPRSPSATDISPYPNGAPSQCSAADDRLILTGDR